MNACGEPCREVPASSLHPREGGRAASLETLGVGGSVWTSVHPVGGKVRLHRTPSTVGESVQGWIRESGGELGRGAGPGLEGRGTLTWLLGFGSGQRWGRGRGLSGGGRGVSEGRAEISREGAWLRIGECLRGGVACKTGGPESTCPGRWACRRGACLGTTGGSEGARPGRWACLGKGRGFECLTRASSGGAWPERCGRMGTGASGN